ncbi:MAG: transposase [Candidatus Cloacimonadota bacterium]
MNSLTRVSLALILLGNLFFALGIVWLDNLQIQSIFLLSLGFVLAFRKGWTFVYKELRGLAPFLLGWVAVYGIFALSGFKPAAEESAGAYWLSYGSSRAMVLLNILFAIQIVASWLKWRDLMSLPLRISSKKYLILGKSLYETAFSTHTALGCHVSLIPTNQHAKGWKHSFNLKLCYLLALLTIVLQESEIRGEAIDNRIKHCYGSKP